MRRAVIDLDVFAANLAWLRGRTGANFMMVVVKADGYGHGALPIARAALAAGADALGVVDIDEALALRGAGISAPIVAWLVGPDADYAAAVRAEVSVAVSSAAELAMLLTAAEASGGVARVALEVDTGLNRGGVRQADWASCVAAIAAAEADDRLIFDGLMSHLANASAEANALQAARFDQARTLVHAAGLNPLWVLLEASEAALGRSHPRPEGIRVGISAYGLSPLGSGVPFDRTGLRAVMRLVSRVAAVNPVAEGEGVSYGFDWRAARTTRIALVPFGYADGLPRSASGRAQVAIRGVRYAVVGRIAMDQIMVDVGDASISTGDEVVLWGEPERGEPSADEWAAWAGTIGYELVTKVGRRVRYEYRADSPHRGSAGVQ